MASVFLSYSSQDREIARLVSDELKRLKHNIVVDVDAFVVGAAFRDALMKSLLRAEMVVPLISKNSMNSPFVISEVGAARALSHTEKKIGLFPVMLGDIPIPSFIQDFWVLRVAEFDVNSVRAACVDLDRAIQKYVEERAETAGPRLFISHRHKDEAIAAALVSVLEAAFDVSTADIRCTSVFPYRLRVGDRTADRLRDEIRSAQVVLGLLAPDTQESSYVLFELGAAWSQAKFTCPLLIRGASREHLPDPIKDLHPLTLSDSRECEELVDEISRATSVRRKSGVSAAVTERISKLTTLANSR